MATVSLAGVMIASALAVYALSHTFFWHRREFLYCAFLSFSAVLVLNWALKSHWVLVVSLVFSNVLQYLIAIYTDHDFNQRVDSNIRASFMSSKAFVISLFSALSMPVAGYFMDKSLPIDVLLYMAPGPLLGLWFVWKSDKTSNGL